MLLTVLFLISCVITARIFDKKRMSAATIAYSVMFVVLLTALLLTVDFGPINQAFTNIMGEEAYLQTKEAFICALDSAGYGTCIYIALFLTFILQVATAMTLAVTGLVRVLSKRKEIYRSKREKRESSYFPRERYLKKRIHLMYCRMLN